MAEVAAEQPKVKKLVRPDLHVADYGNPGSRKSTFFATFPQPIVVGHFDAVGKDMPYWKLGTAGKLQRDPKFGYDFREIISADKLLACRIEYYHDPLVDQPRAAAAFIERLVTRAQRDGVEAVADIQMQGRFNDSCTFCEMKEWCRVGRPTREANIRTTFVPDPWDPLRQE